MVGFLTQMLRSRRYDSCHKKVRAARHRFRLELAAPLNLSFQICQRLIKNLRSKYIIFNIDEHPALELFLEGR